MKKAVKVGICLLFLGICTADSANLIPSVILMSSGATLMIGQKLCGTLAL